MNSPAGKASLGAARPAVLRLGPIVQCEFKSLNWHCSSDLLGARTRGGTCRPPREGSADATDAMCDFSSTEAKKAYTRTIKNEKRTTATRTQNKGNGGLHQRAKLNQSERHLKRIIT